MDEQELRNKLITDYFLRDKLFTWDFRVHIYFCCVGLEMEPINQVLQRMPKRQFN